MMRVLDSGKFLCVAILVMASTLAVNGATSKGIPIVKNVSFNSNGESLEVKIIATENAKYTYFELSSPPRLVVDFHGIQNEISFKEKQIESAGVQRVRASYFKSRNRQATRIVFDLTGGVPYAVTDDGAGTVRVIFGTSDRAPMNLTAGPPVMVEENKPEWHLTNLPAIKLNSPLFQEELLPPAPPVLTAPAPEAEAMAVSKVPAAAAPAAAPSLPSFQGQTNIIVGPPMTPQMPLANPQPIPQYTGELISVDMTNMSIPDFFRLISELSGLNIVLDPGVSGTTPALRLTEVPWDQALDIVLKNHGLTGQLQGNVLRIATNATIQAEEAARANLRAAQQQAAPLDTRTFILNYTQVAPASATLQRLLSPRGTMIPDARKNALIISDIPEQFPRIVEMIRFLDTPAQQVEIEARLLSANKSFSRDIGNQLGFLVGNRSGNILTGVPNQSSPWERTPPPRAVSGGNGVPLVANFPAAATSGLSFLLQPGGDILLDEIISAAETRGTAKLISRPKVVTQNNQQATVSQGTQIPVQTNVNNTVTVQFLDFNLQLDVTPQITDAGTILLTVAVENSQPDFARAVNGVPSVSTQRATTQVLIPDGATTVIGGILVDSDSVNVEQVPGLGSLPIIGHLFKSTTTLKSTAELLFFVTARIKPQDALNVVPPATPPPGSGSDQR